MQYNLGAIGVGHWFERLYIGIKESNKIAVTKAAGINPAKSKLDRLNAIGLTESEYYQLSRNASIPKEFFDRLDIVHISDPNEFHAAQTKEALAAGKVTITEKTWAISRRELDDVIHYIRSNSYEQKAYLHLHYAHKLLNLELEGLLKRCTERYGRVTGVSTTFFEKKSPGDERRKEWLFSTLNGGLFMDWIHPFEILYCGAKAERMRLNDIELYQVNPEYDEKNPTGIHAEVSVSGRFFKDATAYIRIAKGSPEAKKSARFAFESGRHLDLNYLDSEAEFNSEDRGTWELFEEGRVIEHGAPKGPTSSKVLVNDMVSMCEGRKVGLSIDDVIRLYEPQWQYQELIKGKSLRANRKENDRFIKCGLTLSTDSCILSF